MDKAFRYRLYKYTKELTDNLDSEFYIDDIELANLNQQNIVNQLYKALKTDIQDQASSIVAKLTYNNAEGQNVTIGNAIREILTENTKQSKALMSFSTDLAMELNQGFDETLSRQMQQKIVPLMESVDASLRSYALNELCTSILECVFQLNLFCYFSAAWLKFSYELSSFKLVYVERS